MSQEHSFDCGDLFGYLEGSLSDRADLEVERHLQSCEACAALVDRYVGALGRVEEPPVHGDEQFDAAVARLDARMAPYLGGPAAGQMPRALAWLCRVHSIGTLVGSGAGRLGPLLQDAASQARPPRMALATDASPGAASAVVEDVRTLGPGRREGRTTAQLDLLAPETGAVELILEFNLAYLGWEAAVVYLLADGAAALLLYSGTVDQEGLIEYRATQNELPLEAFEPARLKIALLAPYERNERRRG
jgi:hypothetical protein